jgi:DNA polymerase I-like protein with 3'-5' exonuclease and polymerase domains
MMPEAYQLLHDGAKVLSQIEANGIRVDTKYLTGRRRQLDQQIKELSDGLQQDPLYKIWRREFGASTKLGNRTQLGHVLFTILKFPCTQYTKTGRPATDEAAFDNVDHPFVKQYTRLQKLLKAKATYLDGIAREVVDGYLHTFFNLHTVQTYRGSSDHPNFQNFPIRNPEIGEMIRRSFIARPGHVLVEVDFSGIEVRVAACYNRDPNLIRYIKDPSKDMHRDMAAQCYKLKTDQVTKKARYCGKNMFVFPQFYGDYYVNCARSLWEAMERMDLTREDGVSLKKHLAEQGITQMGLCDPKSKDKPRPGTFEKHIQQVQDHFWGERFKVYADWKEEWYRQYRKTGEIQMLTGFRIEGLYRKNEIINSPIQGAAFHCLLWSLIQLQKELKGRRSVLVGQIHDSIVADVHVSELDWFLKTAKVVMTERLLDHWDWIIVPMEVEAEVCPEGGSWHDKKGVNL